MDADLRDALATGYERLAAWSELLDRINVFPVADGDTGRNLAISLAPLRRTDLPAPALVRALLFGARGNSGNIAARFFAGFLDGDGAPLRRRVERGRELAWQAVADPRPGTMLSLLDALPEAFDAAASPGALDALLDRLAAVVRESRERIERLREAGVPDAGALGAFLLFEGFLARRAGRLDALRDPTARFPDAAAFRPSGDAAETGFCVDAVVRATGGTDGWRDRLAALGDSVVAIGDGERVKLHVHADDPAALRRTLERLGAVERWAADDLAEQSAAYARPAAAQALHVMTDAAGSLSRDAARRLGITLLDSYVSIDDASLPETRLPPDEPYGAMRAGRRVCTAQASTFERHQRYASVLRLHGPTLYLCVGSVYTGNHAAATAWRRANDPGGRLTVLDTGAASGRLGLLARATAERARDAADPAEVVAFARRAIETCREWIFLDRLQWLAAGGRMSRGGAFFGDLLHVKPIVSPLPEGATKVGVVHRAAEQLPFALARLAETLGPDGAGRVLLQHSDNVDRVAGEILPELRARFPAADVEVAPLSNTSAAHMGPGTWAVAALPADAAERAGR